MGILSVRLKTVIGLFLLTFRIKLVIFPSFNSRIINLMENDEMEKTKPPNKLSQILINGTFSLSM